MLYDPGRSPTWRGCRQCSVSDETPYRGRANGQNRRRFIDRCLLAFRALTLPMNGDIVLMTQGADAPAGPAMSVAGGFTKAIENGRYRLVWHMTRQGSHKLNYILFRAPVRSASTVLLDRQAGMIATTPVNDHFQCVADDVDDDFCNNGSDYLFARLVRGSRTIPGRGDVAPECHETLPIHAGEMQVSPGVELANLSLKTSHGDESLVPTPLQLVRDKPVIRVDCVVLAVRPSRLETGLPEREVKLVPLLGALLVTRLDSREGGFYAQGLEAVDHLGRHHSIRAIPTEVYAFCRGNLVECAYTLVAGRPIAVPNVKLPPAACAAEKTDE